MKRSTRVLILLVVLEVLLLGLGSWLLGGLADGSLHASASPADAAATVWSVLGGVAGALAGLLLVIWFVMRRRGL